MIKQRRKRSSCTTRAAAPSSPRRSARDRDHLSLSPKADVEADVKAAIAAHARQRRRIKDMGKVIGALKAKYTGQMDFGKASGHGKGGT